MVNYPIRYAVIPSVLKIVLSLILGHCNSYTEPAVALSE